MPGPVSDSYKGPKDLEPMIPIPVRAAKEIAERYGYDQVVIVARRVSDSDSEVGGEHAHHLRCQQDSLRYSSDDWRLPQVQSHGMEEGKREDARGLTITFR